MRAIESGCPAGKIGDTWKTQVYNWFKVGKLNVVKKKALKSLAKSVPGNSLRIWFLRLSNYRIGKNVYIGEELVIIDDLKDRSVVLVIEDRVAISPRVTFVMHSAPNWSRIRNIIGDKKGKIRIKQDAWIGTGAVILPGIEIGEGAIVGANSLVTKDVPDYTIVGGIPAKKIETLNVPWRKDNGE
jgi:acetyltransferase-like isoleucine patch superfamily enzyme